MQNHEHHDIHKISCENNETHENLIILFENNEKSWKQKQKNKSCDNNENHENQIQTIIITIYNFWNFMWEQRKSWKSNYSIRELWQSWNYNKKNIWESRKLWKSNYFIRESRTSWNS